MQEVTIRVMRSEDLDSISRIDMSILGASRDNFWEKKIEVAEKISPISSLVAEAEGKVVGFLLGNASGWEYGVPEDIGWIDTVGVDPDYQHKGIARMLMEEMVNNMRKVGVKTIYTLVNWKDSDLLKFFSSLGFRRGDMINLELNLDDP